MNENIDLIALIENDLGPGRRSGRWVLFHCPFPGHAHGDRNPSLGVTNGDANRGAGWKCFACGKSGDAVRWLIEFDNLSYLEAAAILDRAGARVGRTLQEAPPVQQPDLPPAGAWQARARRLVERAEAALWDERGRESLAWLRARGLKDTTIRGAHIGFIPRDFTAHPDSWGITGQDLRLMYFSEGVVIPGQIGESIWYLKIRPLHPRDGQKYKHVRGGRQALYLADTLTNEQPAVFCEGELDALLLQQEAGEIARVVTLASATGDLNLATWGIYLLRPSRFILAQDMDEAGEKAAAKLAWLRNSQRLKIPIVKPGAKDLTDYHLAGGDLRALIEAALSA